MRTTVFFAIILIALGIVAFGHQGATFTTGKNAVHIGPLKMTAEETKTLPLPTIVGAIALMSGIGLLIMGNRKGSEKINQ